MCGFDPFKTVGRALASIDPGPSIGNALAKIDPGPAIGGALAGLDDLVGDIVPGGWGTIAKIALTATGVPAPIANGLVTVAEGVHRGQSPEQALLNGIKSGAITAATAGVIKGIESAGVNNVIADWEFAANNGSFADAASYFSDNYVAPAISSNLSNLDGIDFSGWSLGDIGKITGISSGSFPSSSATSGSGSNQASDSFSRFLEQEVGKQISGVGQQVSDLTGQFGQYKTEQQKRQEEEQREKRGKESVDLLSQMATGSVKTPPVAKIDYLYDISGDSIFATPKQESLMPSPFEETPEAVEGAMPRYQYYAPGGGYQFSGGGMVAFEEGGDVTQEELEAALRPVTYNQKLAAYGEQRRAQQPEKEMSADDLMLAEIAAGFHPVIGPALSAKDFEEARGENNYLGMGLAGLGMIPVLGGAVKGYNRLVKPALQRRAAQRADTEMVERYGKIPEGEPVPKGYFGGPPVGRERVSLLDTADQVNYYSSPKFQTQYGKEFTHDLVHGSPSSEVMAFNPRASGAQDELARESSSYFNPLLTARRSSDDTTTFLSPDAMYSDQYLPTIASKAPTGYGFPIPKKEYKEGATMYPVSARLGKIFDPESKDALNVTEEFLGTIQRPKNMSAKDFDRNLGDLEKLLKNGDPKVIESPDFSNFLKERGYDSFAFIKKGKGEQVKNYGVFEPSRIRGKFAEFNPEFANSPEIMKAEGGLIGADELQTIDDLYEILRSK
jgi:hypothetical protein